MAEEFIPINSEEDFAARVAERYGDVANLQQQITTLTGERDAHAATIAQQETQIKGFQMSALREKIAREKGLPHEMAARLSGETEKDIRSDADAVAAMIRTIKGPAPLAQTETPTEEGDRAALRNMLRNLKGE